VEKTLLSRLKQVGFDSVSSNNGEEMSMLKKLCGMSQPESNAPDLDGPEDLAEDMHSLFRVQPRRS
jgi:hypothetical protein